MGQKLCLASHPTLSLARHRIVKPSSRTFGSALTQNLLLIFGDDETIKAWAGTLVLSVVECGGVDGRRRRRRKIMKR